MRRARWLLPVVGLCVWAIVATTATSTIPHSSAGSSTLAATAAELAPPECAALSLSGVVTGSGKVNGTRAGELILGDPGPDRIKGRGGGDCILGGGGDDTINGSGGRDVCVGGPGNDTFRSCSAIYQ